MKLTTLQECEQALLAFVPPPRSQREKYNLRRMRAFMQSIGNPQHSYQVVHVAGTSGKTSTCYYLAALFKESGLKTGLTVSPHITKVSERVQINLAPLSDDLFAHELTVFLALIKKVGIALTYFELLMAFAYWSFARAGVDVAVIETGIGGLFDGSNIVHNPSKVCVLTDIGLDHTAILGKTIPEIAAQKAGIIGENNEVFCWSQPAPVMAVFKNATFMQHAKLHVLHQEYSALPALMPQFQKRNFSLAVTVAQWVLKEKFNHKLTKKTEFTAAKQAIPARMEQFRAGTQHITLDGAHNPQKMQALVQSYEKLHKTRPAVLFACIEGPDNKIEQTIKGLLKLKPVKIIITSFQSLQDMKKVSVSPEIIKPYFAAAGYTATEIIEDPINALKKLTTANNDILITGSLYLIFEVRPSLLHA